MQLKAFGSCLILIMCVAIAGRAQDSGRTVDPSPGIRDILQSSQQHMRKAEECLGHGEFECARREFDLATDIVVDSGIDVRSDTALRVYWRQLIERIYRYQSSDANPSMGLAWGSQGFDGRPPEDLPAQTSIGKLHEAGPLTIQSFQQRFAMLQDRFRERFGRDIVITGADHEEHRRLYGTGSAFDVRVKDLSSEQIKFIIETGRALGLRVKDFSTWDKVQAHNARVFGLGLQSDTLATSVHLHIDRNPDAARTRYVADPAYARQH